MLLSHQAHLTLPLPRPGLRTATAASGTVAITKVASSTRNLAFNRSAIVLAARQPARPTEGDLALDVTQVTDPRSGLTFEISVYPGNRMVRYEVALAWASRTLNRLTQQFCLVNVLPIVRLSDGAHTPQLARAHHGRTC